jgi:hypothetical protein
MNIQNFLLDLFVWLVAGGIVMVIALFLCTFLDGAREIFRLLWPKGGNKPNRVSVNTKKGKIMTRIHEAVMGALLPWSKQQTAAAKNAATQTRLTSDQQAQVDWVRSQMENASDQAYVADTLRYVARNNPGLAHITRALNDYGGQGATGVIPVGAVVVCIGGTSRNKRVMNRGYLVKTAGESPVPLGLRGSSERRQTPFVPGEFRLATDAEISDTLARLTSAQVKSLVCDLSATQPWKDVLAGVISNPATGCGRC